jgi:hypothetical protein
MPTPTYENQVFLVWENNQTTPITAAALSKGTNFTASYQDFDIINDNLAVSNPHKENTILLVDTYSTLQSGNYLTRLIMKNGVSIAIVNTNKDSDGNYYVDVNDQYKYFDVGLQDLFITTNDIDSDIANNPVNGNNKVWGNPGELRQWFVFLCDNEDSATAKLLCSQSSDHPTGTPIGFISTTQTPYVSPTFTSGNCRMIGGFKTNSDGTINPSSLWDISGKSDTVRAKQYMILDEYAQDPEDSSSGVYVETPIKKRYLYRALRPNDLDSTSDPNNFGNSINVTGSMTATGNISATGNLSTGGNLSVIGNLSTGGNLSVIGNLSTGGNLSVTGTTQTAATFDVGTILPTQANNLNYNGYLTSTQYRVPFINGAFDFINQLTVPIISTSITASLPTTSKVYNFPDAGSNGTILIAANSQKAGFFDIGSVLPSHSNVLNYDGQMDATQFRVPYSQSFTFVNAVSPTIYTSIAATTPTTTRNYVLPDIGSTNGTIMISPAVQTPGYFDTTTNIPANTNRLNYNGNLYVTQMISTAVSSGAAHFQATSGTGWVYIFGANSSPAANNPIIQTNDSAIIFTNGTSGTGNLVIAPYNSSSSGLRMTSTGSTILSGNFSIVGTTQAAGYFDAGTIDPSSTTRLNYDGSLYATQFVSSAVSPSSLTPGAVYGGTTVPNSNQQVNINGSLYATQFVSSAVSPSSLTPGAVYGGTTVPNSNQQVNVNGNLYATKVFNAVWNDLAEYFRTDVISIPGKVYVIENGMARLSRKRADKRVIGVCSNTAAYIMKSEYEKNGVLIGLSGTLDVWIKSKIEAGDELVSDKDGFATKANWFEKIVKRGSILGKALVSKDTSSEEKILMLITRS